MWTRFKAIEIANFLHAGHWLTEDVVREGAAQAALQAGWLVGGATCSHPGILALHAFVKPEPSPDTRIE